jgi:transcription-repair coupling factor (superfamily II helicase)
MFSQWAQMHPYASIFSTTRWNRYAGSPPKPSYRVTREVSEGIAHGGIEYYLPLFFDTTASFADYLPANCVVLAPAGLEALLEQFWSEAHERYELCSLDTERPILSVEETFAVPEAIPEQLAAFPGIRYTSQSLATAAGKLNLDTRLPPAMKIEARYEDAAAALVAFLDEFEGRVLFSTDSPGRREQLFDMLTGRGLDLARVDTWQGFRNNSHRVGVAIAPVDNGVLLPGARLAIISEQQLFGERTRARKRRRRSDRDPETIIRQLNDLEPGSPVVHEEYGVGRYLGLTTLEAGGIEAEFLHLEYADGDKLYVPVHALDLISRYTGASPDNGPRKITGTSKMASRLNSPRTRGTQSTMCLPISQLINRWIVSSVVTSALARRKWPCARRLPRYMGASRLQC